MGGEKKLFSGIDLKSIRKLHSWLFLAPVQCPLIVPLLYNTDFDTAADLLLAQVMPIITGRRFLKFIIIIIIIIIIK